jgi:hypothetical protein
MPKAKIKTPAQIKVERAIGRAKKGVVRMSDGGRPPLRSLGEEPTDEYLNAEIARLKSEPVVPANSPTETANYARYVAERASQPIDMPAMPDYTSAFSVLEKPTYGSEVPNTIPTIDQQRYELTMKGQQEAENRERTKYKDFLTGVDPSGTLGIMDALRTTGMGMLALPAHAGRTAFHWLQHGNLKDAPTGQDYEESMAPRTPEGAELLEEIGTAGSRLTGSEMGFGMHPNLWVNGLGTPSVAQMRAGLKLGAERAAPVLGKIDQAVRTGYESGAIPQPGLSIKDVTPRVLALANEQGFYSPTEAAALNLQRKSGNGQQFLNDILKGDNVKADEISNMGLDTWLKGKKEVTAAEVQDYIAQNKLGLDEARYGEFSIDEYHEALDKIAMKKYGKYYTDLSDDEMQWVDRYHNKNSKDTKFSGYSLPGGENYREVVITMPAETKARASTPEEALKLWKEDARAGKRGMWTEDEIKAISQDDISDILHEEYLNPRPKQDQYRSSHWDEPNPLAHLRMSDRVTDGKKTLLVDEVQSDWHQAGREQGYRIPDPVKKNEDGTFTVIQNDGTVMNFPATTDVDMLRGSFGADAGVPDAPFKDDWYQLALKRAVKEAIDGGYDRVALTTGDRVNERFDLSKKIDRIDYNKNDDGTYRMSASKGGEEVFVQEWIKEKELPNILGKELANKLIKNEGELPSKDILKSLEEEEMPVYKTLSGLDLKVGGEGNRKYYDEIYPNYLKKFGKKYGASVGKTTVEVEGAPEPLHYMEITPAMREAFKTGIHMKDGGSVNLAEGGIVAGSQGLKYADDGDVSMEAGGYVPMRRGGKVELTNDLAKMRNELQMKKGRK